MKSIPTLLFVFVFLIKNAAFAIDFEPLNTNNGLPSNHVYDINQDSDGFMWFATNRGLVKYDGVNCKIFTLKDGLPTNDIWHIESDEEGRLWYFSNSSHNGYIKNDTVYSFINSDSAVVSPVSVFWSGNSFGYFGNGSAYKLKDNIYQNILNGDQFLEITEKIEPKFKETNLVQLWIRENGIYPIVQQAKNILVLDSNLNVIFEKKIGQKLGQVNNSGALSNDLFFIATVRGVLLIHLKNHSIHYFSFESYSKPEKIKHVFCTKTFNKLQVTIPNLLVVFNLNLSIDTVYTFPEHISNHRSFRDRDGNIWLADLKEGIKLFSDVKLESHSYLAHKKIATIGKIGNQIMAGVSNEGFYHLNKELDKFELDSNLSTNEKVYSFQFNPKEKTSYLISHQNSFEYGNDSIKTLFTNIKDALNQTTISSGFKSIASTKNPDIKYVADHSQLLKYDFNKNRVLLSIYRTGIYQLIVIDSLLYVGCTDGLYVLSGDSLIRPPLKNKIINSPINRMISYENTLIVGTNGSGIYILKNQRIAVLKSTNNLMIQDILIHKKSIWLATQVGVKAVSFNKKHPENSYISNSFNQSDGLDDNNINSIYMEDNLLYTATDQGISVIDIKNIAYTKKINLIFNSVRDTIELNYDQASYFSQSFSVIDYNNQDQLKFSYQLKPIQEKWIPIESKTIHFSNLSPNFYTLTVQVQNHHFNTTTKSVYISVLPAWWQTSLAKLGFILLVVLFIALIGKLILLRIRKKELIRIENTKRLARFELQALRSQMNPHFVHNSLNAIQYYIQRNEVELSENYLTKFSKLIRHFFDYAQEQTISIQEELALLKNYLEIEYMRFEDKLEYDFFVDNRLDIEEQMIPTMILQPIVENAVNHGVFHIAGVGEIKIEFHFINKTTYQVIIKDNGIGLLKSQQLEKHQKKDAISSTDVLKERLELLKKSKSWSIDYTAIDLFEKTNEQGTKISLLFKKL